VPSPPPLAPPPLSLLVNIVNCEAYSGFSKVPTAVSHPGLYSNLIAIASCKHVRRPLRSCLLILIIANAQRLSEGPAIAEGHPGFYCKPIAVACCQHVRNHSEILIIGNVQRLSEGPAIAEGHPGFYCKPIAVACCKHVRNLSEYTDCRRPPRLLL
jgi:hypothetical protein